MCGRKIILLPWLAGLLFSCSYFHNKDQQDISPLFKLIDNKNSGVDFVNEVEYTEKYNTYTYRNFYNGGGVGLGDFNNDGLTDLYFTGNLADNKLYLNKGNFIFEDITEKAGVACPGVWSTGVSIADVNGDGWLDLYVCKSGIIEGKPNRHNELFINNGNLTFTDRSVEYGLDITGLSTNASFFDYDKDGDLDMYLLSNAYKSVENFKASGDQRKIRDPGGGNKLFRNDGQHFTDVSEKAGIYGSAIGFGLGVSVCDINRDGWDDIYVSNDFFEKDYLYINNQDGTFSEKLEEYIRELSRGSMGSDLADINNDGFPEIFVTEMTPEPEGRYKTKAMFQSWDQYEQNVKNGYYRQFERNVLQLNNRNGSFSEIGRLAGISTTDWSWGALILDMDNDGRKDIFVANGIFKDLLDRDYNNFYSDPAIVRNLIMNEQHAILTMINDIPSVRIPNYAFKNAGRYTFKNMAGTWGLDKPSFSNGAAYGDLDNDGDLDLVINNVNMPPFLYRNLSGDVLKNSYIEFKLTGEGMNSRAIGTRITLYCGKDLYYQEMIPVRGFQSSVDDRPVFGLGKHTKIDSALIIWPDDRITRLYDVAANQLVSINITGARKGERISDSIQEKPVFREITASGILDYQHVENEFNEFARNRLLFYMVSNEGPKIACGDINGDKRMDLIIGGARGEAASAYVQAEKGGFCNFPEQAFYEDTISEDEGCLLFDADNDGDLDLYIASGGNEFPSSSTALIDRLYFNDGTGQFTRSEQILPATDFESTSCVVNADFDLDGDQDLAVGIRLKPSAYGLPANGYILQNDGNGQFTDVTGKIAPGLLNIGMITDMSWADIDQDEDMDLMVVGEYMPVTVFVNTNGKFTNRTESYGLKNSSGWWRTIEKADLDGDGDIDFVAGNFGLNTRFKATASKPITLYVNDFDRNGSVDPIICRYNGDKSYPMVLLPDLIAQIPVLKSKYPNFDSYKEQTINDIFTPEQIDESVKRDVVTLSTSVLINNGNGTFTLKPLPVEAQFTPVYAISIDDFDHDGLQDILLGGNLYRAKPEVGICDGSYGTLLKGDGNGNYNSVPYNESGFSVKGEIRDFRKIVTNDRQLILVAVNNQKLKIFTY